MNNNNNDNNNNNGDNNNNNNNNKTELYLVELDLFDFFGLGNCDILQIFTYLNVTWPKPNREIVFGENTRIDEIKMMMSNLRW